MQKLRWRYLICKRRFRVADWMAFITALSAIVMIIQLGAHWFPAQIWPSLRFSRGHRLFGTSNSTAVPPKQQSSAAADKTVAMVPSAPGSAPSIAIAVESREYGANFSLTLSARQGEVGGGGDLGGGGGGDLGGGGGGEASIDADEPVPADNVSAACSDGGCDVGDAGDAGGRLGRGETDAEGASLRPAGRAAGRRPRQELADERGSAAGRDGGRGSESAGRQRPLSAITKEVMGPHPVLCLERCCFALRLCRWNAGAMAAECRRNTCDGVIEVFVTRLERPREFWYYKAGPPWMGLLPDESHK